MVDKDKQSTNPDAKPSDGKAAAKAAADPLQGTEKFGVADAGGKEAHAELVAGDPHAFEAIPGANGPEAIGSGQPVIEPAAEAMADRFDANVPEPPKVGPIPNTDLYDTPGGYQVVPAGVKPSELPVAGVVSAGTVGKKTAESSDKHSEQVAGPGSVTAS